MVDVPTGEEAIQVFERNPTHFDVAVLDVMMPGMDGFEVCRRIREKNSSIGIIMLTAKSQEMDKVNGLMIGADDYVTSRSLLRSLWHASMRCTAVSQSPLKRRRRRSK